MASGRGDEARGGDGESDGVGGSEAKFVVVYELELVAVVVVVSAGVVLA